MKLKNIFINLSLTFSAIYIPLILLSGFYIFSNKLIDKKWIRRESFQKVEAVNSGYLPTFNPSIVSLSTNQIPFYPIGTLPNTRTYLCNEGYGLIKYKTDRFGLRNSDSNWDNIYKQSNIFVIGDSFVLGECVPENATISSNIKKLTNYNTLNLGMGGNSPYEYRAILKSIIQPIIKNSSKKNIVIIVFYINDHIQDIIEKEKLLESTISIIESSNGEDVIPKENYTRNIIDFIKNNYPQSKKEIISKINQSSKKSFKDSSFYRIISLYPIRTRFGLINLTGTGSLNQKYDKTSSRKSIALLSEICKSSCTPIVAYIPNSSFWYPKRFVKEYKKELKQLSVLNGIEFIDGEDAIDKNNLDNYAPKGPHLSIVGYEKMADLIISKIKK